MAIGFQSKVGVQYAIPFRQSKSRSIEGQTRIWPRQGSIPTLARKSQSQMRFPNSICSNASKLTTVPRYIRQINNSRS